MKKLNGFLGVVATLLIVSVGVWVTHANAGMPFSGWLQLSGGYAQVPYQDEINIDPASGNFTIEGWIDNPYFIDSSSLDTLHGTVYKASSFSLFFSRFTTINPPPGHTTCSVAFASCGSSFCTYQGHALGTYAAGSSCPPPGWVHFAYVYNQATNKGAFFWNGQMLGSDESVPLTSTNPIVLQKAVAMDEVRISNNVRYIASFTPASVPFECDANTQALWHFNEITGTTTFHDSCGSFDNSLVGYNGAHTEGVVAYYIYLPLAIK
jgi:hypothetical protein